MTSFRARHYDVPPVDSENRVGDQVYTNCLNMTLTRIKAGSFLMGQIRGGDADEAPIHKVRIRRPFYLSVWPVTNAQYEQFDPTHRQYRGIHGLSRSDDEAVLFVSWHDATRFCEWLREKEGKAYRLPTEAEWEYACRAGTTGEFATGDDLPTEYWRSQEFNWWPKRISLACGSTPPNRWGVCDMHGLVEEWCFDWYGPYEAQNQEDPTGRISGLFKVTRGGSHNTGVRYLRSANRLGTLPEDRHWLIGFRVVLGERPRANPLPAISAPPCMSLVSQKAKRWNATERDSQQESLFTAPVCYIRRPVKGTGTPFYKHHHCPAITWCPNGDLLVAWFTTNSERGRELAILASRLRAGQQEWDPASEFFKAPDRNMTGTSLFNDGRGTLYHANGLSVGDGWASLALVTRTSRDNGATWSVPTIAGGHRYRNQVIAGMSMTREGCLIQPCDATYKGRGGTAIHISRDAGKTWEDPGEGTPKPRYQAGASGATIAGIHAGVVELADGRLLAVGRGDNIAGRMPMSVSGDGGKTWSYDRSEFPPISSCQRPALLRLKEGPLLLLSFTDRLSSRHPRGFVIRDAGGRRGRVYGLFAALSMDEGVSWPVKRLLTDGGPGRIMETLDGRTFTMSETTAEPAGYLAATQTPDGIIHVVSSYLYYRLNLAWLKTKT